jgi:uncharacterized membrane protein YoaK (UPF0700 family)
MSRPLESFEFLNRGWDVRLLEQQSLRSVFVVLLIDVFMFGVLTFMATYQWFRLHRFDWLNLILLLLFVLPICRYSPVVYRRLRR